MSLEIKIPKEVRKYHESVFFGLSIRQMVCSGIAIGAAVGAYFGLREPLGQETVSWVCVLCAAPFAIAGFFSYNGLTLEQFIVAGFRSEFRCAGPRRFIAVNRYRLLQHEVENPPKVRRTKKKRKKNKGVKRK